jgi:ATP-binding cassette subfamily B protein
MRSTFTQLKGLWPFLKPHRGQLALAGVALLLAALSALLVPVAFRQLIDFGFSKGSNPRQVDLYFAALMGIATLLALATAARFYMVSWLGERVTSDMKSAIYSHVIAQSPEFFETTQTGEVVSRLSADITLIQTLIGTSLSMGLRNGLLFLGGLLMMFITSPTLAAWILLLLIFVVLPFVFMGRRVRKLSRASLDRVADSSALAGEMLNAASVVQSFAREKIEGQRFSQSVENAFKSAIARIRARSVLTVMAILLVFAAIVFVLWLGAHAVVRGEMSGGALAQFILYAVIVAGSIAALSEVMGDMQRAVGATERLLELLHLRSQIQTPAQPQFLSATQQGLSIEFKAVTFAYPSRPEVLAVNQLNLQIAAGETIALVGTSGAGKTTLFQLLQRFYETSSGQIKVQGIDVREVELQNLRSQIGVVPQDTVIFSSNALENIRFGRANASDEEVINAAKAAAAHDFISALPEGYQSFLGERGVRLSGGQKQRIAIARALLKNPPLLLLDEATSALDAESERAVQQALEAAMTGRTTLIIAHRLATVKKANRIVVLENGRVIETGTHDELVAQNGQYAKLAALQFRAA